MILFMCMIFLFSIRVPQQCQYIFSIYVNVSYFFPLYVQAFMLSISIRLNMALNIIYLLGGMFYTSHWKDHISLSLISSLVNKIADSVVKDG
jgi:hypothetical protein